VFALPLVGSALLEAGLALVADRYPRRRVTGLALLALSVALVLCALATQGLLLALGLALAGAASGVACGAAQSELVAANPAAGARAMTRWVLFGSVGDVLTPLLVALVLGAGGSYRVAFVAAAALVLLQGAVLIGADGRAAGTSSAAQPPAPASADPADPADPADSDDPEDAEAVPLLTALREGVRNASLWRWLIAAGLCTFLDEIVVAFAALHAERDLGASSAAAVACVTGVSAGAVLGAGLTDRLLGAVAPDRVLLGSTLATVFALAAVVLAPSPAWLALALVGLGASAAPQYALTKAKAYAASPGRPGVVNALSQVFVLVDIVGPLALGALADSAGVAVAMACLVVQPLGVLLLLVSGKRRAPH
jgi:MFS transporter, FSR family, fosmidomycin resistance protein